jgi:pyruvate, orthophosphate dikinase
MNCGRTKKMGISVRWMGCGGKTCRLMKIAVAKGRSVKADLECGICGEHGGEPKSIGLCHALGLSYVSCSPFRMPIARLAAAHAALKEQ